MQFQVPQFIEVENKIFGPLTFRQFIYLAGGAGLAFALWTFLPKLIGFPLALAALGFGAALAFYKYNNKPFAHLLEASLKYLVNTKLYIWKKEPKKIERKAGVPAQEKPGVYVPRLSDSKLKDLSWSLDVENIENLEHRP